MGPRVSRLAPVVGLVLLLLQLQLLLQQAAAAQSPVGSALLPSFYPATDERVQWVGRVLRDEEYGRATFDWPGVTARFGLERGSALEVSIDDSTPTGTRFAVYLDGPARQFGRQHVQTILTRQGVHSYTLAAGEVLAAAGQVTVSMVHTQEARFIDASTQSNVTVLGFATDGFLAEEGPQPQRPWRMEIIGDSITAGYGSGVGTVPCNASVFTNDFSVTYAHLLCESLNADCFVEAVSGIGMYRSYPDPGPGRNLTMPERYHDTLTGAHGLYPWRPGKDGGGWAPHAVVINLGTNDFQPGRETDGAFLAAFVEAYVAFVTQLAEAYAKVAEAGRGPPAFFLGVGPMRTTYAAAVREVLRRLAGPPGQKAPTGIEAYFLDLALPEGVELGGCNSHPAAAAQRAMAEKARPVIAQAMGWLD